MPSRGLSPIHNRLRKTAGDLPLPSQTNFHSGRYACPAHGRGYMISKMPHLLGSLFVSPHTKNLVSALVTALSVKYPRYSDLIKPNSCLFPSNLDDPQNISGEALELDGTFESAPSVGVAPPEERPAYAAAPAGSACSPIPPFSSPGICEPLPDCRRPCEETK